MIISLLDGRSYEGGVAADSEQPAGPDIAGGAVPGGPAGRDRGAAAQQLPREQRELLGGADRADRDPALRGVHAGGAGVPDEDRGAAVGEGLGYGHLGSTRRWPTRTTSSGCSA